MINYIVFSVRGSNFKIQEHHLCCDESAEPRHFGRVAWFSSSGELSSTKRNCMADRVICGPLRGRGVERVSGR